MGAPLEFPPPALRGAPPYVVLYNTTLQYNTYNTRSQCGVVFLQSNNTTHTTRQYRVIDKDTHRRPERQLSWVVVVLTRRYCCTIQRRIQQVLYRLLVEAFIMCVVLYFGYEVPEKHNTTHVISRELQRCMTQQTPLTTTRWAWYNWGKDRTNGEVQPPKNRRNYHGSLERDSRIRRTVSC
jgi:hypothetical protein